MSRQKVFLADLTHTALGISALSFPLGTAFVASYAESLLSDRFEFQLFKFPEDLAAAVADQQPAVIGFSNYSWNLELGYRLATWAKNLAPETIVIFGGPNFPVLSDEQETFLQARPSINFYIQNEGEVGFVNLLGALDEHDLDIKSFHRAEPVIGNCSYISDDRLVGGEIERILDVNVIPSPYLSGMLDKFFNAPLAPMIETTRGCPFSCAFCADGLDSKNRVVRFDHERTRKELSYIQAHVKDVDELVITDLNFGMYKQDRATAVVIAALQKKTQWPRVVKASAGKNQPERIIEAASLLNGSWVIGSAVQSTDPGVLKNIKRGNISTDAYRQFIDHANQQSEDAQSYTEIILALPGDSKERHFNSLRAGIDNRVNTLRMYQAMLLLGTDMASRKTREEFQLLTKFRILPGCIGVYRFGEDQVAVSEIEEIVVGSRDMSFDDYVSCRIMNLLIETYVNNGLFEEIFASLNGLGVPTFDILLHLHEHRELYSAGMTEIVRRFVDETVNDLYDTREQAEAFALRPDNMAKFMSGELGGNELLEHRALLYLELEEISTVLLASLTVVLEERDLLDDGLRDYFEELIAFTVCKKKGLHESSAPIVGSFNFDFNALKSKRFDIDPRDVRATETGINLRFFHTPEQQAYIRNTVGLYENHPGGIGRMIQRSNLKMMYRQCDYA